MLNIKQIDVQKELKIMKKNFQIKSIERTSEDIDPITSLNFFIGFQVSENLVRTTNLLRVFDILTQNLRDFYFGFNNVSNTILKNNQSIFVNHSLNSMYEKFEKIIEKNNVRFDSIAFWSVTPSINPKYLFTTVNENHIKYNFERKDFYQSTFSKKINYEDFTEGVIFSSIKELFIYFLTHSKKFKKFIEENNLLITGVMKEQNNNLYDNFTNNTQNLLYILSFITTKDNSLKKITEKFKEVVDKSFEPFLNYLNSIFKGEEDYLKLKIEIKKDNQKLMDCHIFANTKIGFEIKINPFENKVDNEKLQILQNKINSQLKKAIKSSRQKIRTKKILNKQDLEIEERCINYDDLIKIIKLKKD